VRLQSQQHLEDAEIKAVEVKSCNIYINERLGEGPPNKGRRDISLFHKLPASIPLAAILINLRKLNLQFYLSSLPERLF